MSAVFRLLLGCMSLPKERCDNQLIPDTTRCNINAWKCHYRVTVYTASVYLLSRAELPYQTTRLKDSYCLVNPNSIASEPKVNYSSSSKSSFNFRLLTEPAAVCLTDNDYYLFLLHIT